MKRYGSKLLCAILFISLSAYTFIVIRHIFFSPLPVLEPQLLELTVGSNISTLSNKLYDRKLINHPKYFICLMRLLNLATKLKAGVYEIYAQDTALSLTLRIVKGDVLKSAVTIIPGMTILDIDTLFKNTRYLRYDPKIWQEVFPHIINPEGLLLADTYYFNAQDSAYGILKTAHQALERALLLAWQDMDANLTYKNPYELLIAASILEKETARYFERKLIAGVINNRLKFNMPLQMDPTILYVLPGQYHRKLKHVDLSVKSLYNSYLHKGLPPTPIAMVGRDAILAAAHPEPSKYLYFVARGDGSHTFSVNYKDHLKAIK
jgi:UPF0755 protein